MYNTCVKTKHVSTRIVSIITLSRLLFNRTQHGIQAPSTPVWPFVRQCNETTNRCHVTFSLISSQRQQQLLYYITGDV